MKTILKTTGTAVAALALYLTLWPVSVQPMSWQSPANQGYTGDFSPNANLANLAMVGLDGRKGPEDADVGPDGKLYLASHDGEILRVGPDNSIEVFAQTNGRPLGIEFDHDGTLFVADAYRGLLSINRDGAVTLLADKTIDGSPILYADDLDVTSDGVVYFSDASTRFGAQDNGGTLAASVLDLVEHSANGRVLKFDSATSQTTVFADRLTFANGVAVNAAEDAVFVVETGAYRVWRFPTDGSPGEVVLENLPGFPDNINNADDGTFWIGLVSPRNAIMDALSEKPFLRRVIMRLPEVMKPAPTRYGFVLRMDEDGNVLETLQDPSGSYALTTGAVSLPDGGLAITSLTEPGLGILAHSK